MNIGIGASGTTAGHGYLWSSSGDVMIGPDGNPTMIIEHEDGTNGRVSIGAHKSWWNGSVHKPAAPLHVGGEIAAFNSEHSFQGQIHIGGGNDEFEDQYLVFPNPGLYEGFSEFEGQTMHWWASDMFMGRRINEFQLGFKSTHKNDYAAKHIIKASVSDRGGNSFLDQVLIAPEEGLVGIGTGTETPTHLLTVNGDIRIMEGGLIFPDNSVLTSANSLGKKDDEGNSIIDTKLFLGTSFNNANFLIDKAVKDNYELAVAGSIFVDGEVKSESLICEVLNISNVPDYVFEEGYHLTDLSEVKEYVSRYKHLKGIPSAQEMVDEGVNLKELNLKLLEKVEELTLHTIRQQEEIEKQEARINVLESK